MPYGPWIDEGPVADSQSFNWWAGAVTGGVPWGGWHSIGTNFPTICDTGLSANGAAEIKVQADIAGNEFGGETDYDGNPIARGDLMGYQQGGVRLSFPLNAFGTLPPMRWPGSGLPTPPAGVVGFQVEGHADNVEVDGDLAWIVSDIAVSGNHWTVNPPFFTGDVTFPDSSHPLAGVVQYRLHVPAITPGPGLSAFTSAATLAAMQLLGSDTFAAGTFDTVYSPAFTIARAYLPASGSSTRAEIDVDVKAVIDHVAPSYGALDPANTDADEHWWFNVHPGIDVAGHWPPVAGDPPGCTYTLAFTYHRPRFRWIFDTPVGVPPLAHRQRRDGTATAGPPLAHIGTSGSRPPLAWRQNTP